MRQFILRRSFKELTLDLVFFLWAVQVLATGHVVPSAVQNLIHPPAHVAAVTQPTTAPPSVTLIDDPLPET